MVKVVFYLLSAVLALAGCPAARAQVLVPVMPEKDGPEASALYRVPSKQVFTLCSALGTGGEIPLTRQIVG